MSIIRDFTMNKLSFRILGIVLVLSSVSIWLNPIIHSRADGMTFDFTEVKTLVCSFLIILGSVFIWTTFKKK
ncbi:MAG: hypothetical protein A2277_03930 [Desulfobacterales bacterium RIFOXYA12_FULL_46_15]|nr:MAG: hypothetical protein A2277_03930 [Desulfobacterales bacterium RIFOXYA12_FULL_46_15]